MPRLRRLHYFKLAQEVEISEYNRDTGTFSIQGDAQSSDNDPGNEEPDDRSVDEQIVPDYHGGSDHGSVGVRSVASNLSPTHSYQHGMQYLRLFESDAEWLADILKKPEVQGSVRLLEVTDDNVVILMMPVLSMSEQAMGTAALATIQKRQEARLNPFCEIHVQHIQFAANIHELCCHCTNPCCTRTEEEREVFARELCNPDQTGFTYEEIFGSASPLCTCAITAIEHKWRSIGDIHEDIEGDSFAAFFVDTVPMRAHLVRLMLSGCVA